MRITQEEIRSEQDFVYIKSGKRITRKVAAARIARASRKYSITAGDTAQLAPSSNGNREAAVRAVQALNLSDAEYSALYSACENKDSRRAVNALVRDLAKRAGSLAKLRQGIEYSV